MQLRAVTVGLLCMEEVCVCDNCNLFYLDDGTRGKIIQTPSLFLSHFVCISLSLSLSLSHSLFLAIALPLLQFCMREIQATFTWHPGYCVIMYSAYSQVKLGQPLFVFTFHARVLSVLRRKTEIYRERKHTVSNLHFILHSYFLEVNKTKHYYILWSLLMLIVVLQVCHHTVEWYCSVILLGYY